MKNWFRRLRGAVGVGVTWAAVWGLAGGILEAIFGLPPGVPGAGVVLYEFARGFVAFSMIGFMGSGVFSIALGFGGRRRSFAEMSLPRFATWGGLAGFIVGLVLYSPLLLAPNGRFTVAEALLRATLAIGVTTVIGAGSASGSLAVARMADDRELLAASEEVAGVGLTEKEARELLG